MTTTTVASADFKPALPVGIAVACVAGLSLAGWGVLVAEALAAGGDAGAWLAAICRPTRLDAAAAGAELRALATAIGLWSAMSIAMMLPVAAPMALTYAAAAGSVARPRLAALSPVFLVAGYLAVWIAVSVVAALGQWALVDAFEWSAMPGASAGILSGALVGAAGLYQFSALKGRCLHASREIRCLDPAGIGRPSLAFRLGLRQGVQCLGCCGALMALMVALGAMSLVWMVIFSLLMSIERTVERDSIPRAIGLALLVAGFALSIGAVGIESLFRLALR